MNIWKVYHYPTSNESYWLNKPSNEDFEIGKYEVQNNLKKGLLITP